MTEEQQVIATRLAHLVTTVDGGRLKNLAIIFKSVNCKVLTSYFMQLTWEGLNERLQPATLCTRAALLELTEIERAKEESCEVLAATQNIPTYARLQAKRQVIADEILIHGIDNVIAIEPVLGWHLADRGIDAAQFKHEMLASEPESRAWGNGRLTFAHLHGIECNLAGNIIHGKFKLSPKVNWSHGVITARHITLPNSIVQGIQGATVTDIIDHPALGGLTVSRAQATTSITRGTSLVLHTRPSSTHAA